MPFHLTQESSAQTPSAPSTPPRPSVPPPSPAERDYLTRQARAIKVHGGSDLDVANFTKLHFGLTPEQRRDAFVGGITETGGEPVVDDNLISGLSLKAFQGATFGWGDEAVGGLMSLITDQTAEEARQEFLGRLERTSEEHPVLSFLAEAGGAALTGGAAARAAKLGIGFLMQGAGAAAGGAVAGAGYTEGDVSERTKMALLGATLGGALGAGVAGAINIATPVVKAGARNAVQQARELVEASPRLRRVIERFQNLPDVMPSSVVPREEALGEFIDSAAEEGLDVNELRRSAVSMIRNGVRPTLADLGGPGTLALLAETTAHRTVAKQRLVEALLTRQAEQGGRLTGDLVERVFRSDQLGLENAYDLERALIKQRSAAAAPLYRQAYEEGMVPVTDRMRALIERNPIFRAAYEEGRRIAGDLDLLEEGSNLLEIPELPSGSLREAARRQLIDLGAGEETIEAALRELPDNFPDALPVRAIDMMKKGMNSVQRRLLDRGGLAPAELKAVTGTLREILEEADNASPVYAEARRIFADMSSAKDAVTLARTRFLKDAPEEITQTLSELTPTEREFYRVGAIQAIRDRIADLTSSSETVDIARRVFGGKILTEPNGREAQRIRALFDSDEAADAFMRKVVAETRLTSTAQSAGPMVPRRFQNPEDIGEGAIVNPRGAGGGAMILTALGAIRDFALRGNKRFKARVADELAVLFSQGLDSPNDIFNLLDELEDFQLRRLQKEKIGTGIRGGLSVAIGAEAGDLAGN